VRANVKKLLKAGKSGAQIAKAIGISLPSRLLKNGPFLTPKVVAD